MVYVRLRSRFDCGYPHSVDFLAGVRRKWSLGRPRSFHVCPAVGRGTRKWQLALRVMRRDLRVSRIQATLRVFRIQHLCGFPAFVICAGVQHPDTPNGGLHACEAIATTWTTLTQVLGVRLVAVSIKPRVPFAMLGLVTRVPSSPGDPMCRNHKERTRD